MLFMVGVDWNNKAQRTKLHFIITAFLFRCKHCATPCMKSDPLLGNENEIEIESSASLEPN